jgi:hypothetical protein
MCDHHSNIRVHLRTGDVVLVDECIAHMVQALNEYDIETVASCCGHGRFPGSIALADGREILVMTDAAAAERAREPYQVSWLASRITQLETELGQMHLDKELGEEIKRERDELDLLQFRTEPLRLQDGTETT